MITWVGEYRLGEEGGTSRFRPQFPCLGGSKTAGGGRDPSPTVILVVPSTSDSSGTTTTSGDLITGRGGLRREETTVPCTVGCPRRTGDSPEEI